MSIVQRWEHLAEPDSNPLLPRARTIAGGGGVSIEIEGNVVRGNVHRGGQASVCHLEVAASPDGSDPVLDSSDCSCTTRNGMCLHVVATIVYLAEQVGENPDLAARLCSPSGSDTTDDEIPVWIPVRDLDPTTFFDIPQQ